MMSSMIKQKWIPSLLSDYTPNPTWIDYFFSLAVGALAQSSPSSLFQQLSKLKKEDAADTSWEAGVLLPFQQIHLF